MPRVHPQPEPIQVALRPLDLAQHEILVTLVLPAGATGTGAVLQLPAWTPGSYLIRDYARFLDRLEAADGAGRPLAVARLDKQRWRLEPAQGPVTVSYRLFCNDLSVRTNHVDAGHAHLVGAASFLYLDEPGPRPYRVAFAGWPGHWRVACALPEEDGVYLAGDHDTLVDSPFELGTFRMHTFSHGGCAFRFAVTGAHAGDEARILAGTRAVVAVAAGIFGGLPFSRYLFLLTFSPGCRGGLEHRDCTSLLADPQQMERAEGYWDLFTLIAHEFFHVWNVKRLRDPALGPFDYQRETMTRLLWFHEGFTSFMQYAIVLRAGAAPWHWVAKRLAGSWTENTTRAGIQEQSLEEASLDAWIRHYKPSEFSANSTVSYYDKGAMVAWMMDAELRLGGHGLDQLFAQLWRRLGDGPVTDADLRAAYGELSGQEPGPFWSAFIQGRAALDPGSIERAYGLSFTAKAPWELLGADAEDPDAVRRARVYCGLAFAGEAATVANVFPGSPAARAGLSYGMAILAVNGWRTVSAAEIERRLGDLAPGDPVEILAVDRGRVHSFVVTLAEYPHRTIQLGPDPRATPGQREAFLAWTGQPHPAGPKLARP